ncbi:MAG: VWA domain-containing protein [Alloacidobacterium sp.]
MIRVTGVWTPFRICAVLLLSMAAPAFAQASQRASSLPTEVEPDPKPGPDTSQGMIKLDVVVTDKSGNPVAGLGQQDFTLLDNGQPAKIVTFQAFDGVATRPNPPVEVILVIDELNMGDTPKHGEAPLEDAKHEAENFLRQNQGHLDQPVSIYRLTQDGLSASAVPSTDGNALADQIAKGKEPHLIWKTPMVSENLDPIEGGRVTKRKIKIPRSLIALGSIAIEERRRPGRKLMFWLGPGWKIDAKENTGLFDLFTELSTRLREARIDLWMATEWPLYDYSGNPVPVSTFVYKDFLEGVKPETIDGNYLVLHVLATQSGGGVIETHSDLAGLIGKRVEQASTFYSLTFDPPRTDQVDESHSLKVEVRNPDLTAHARNGYFDEPVFYDQTPAGAERLTVEQLQQALKTAHASSDNELARRLSAMQLTERLSSAKLAVLEASLKGKKAARQALVALADESVFLAPPASEIPSTPPPDAATQRQIISRAVDYVNKTIAGLPNFFATRTTSQYGENDVPVDNIIRTNTLFSGPQDRIQASFVTPQTWKTAMGDPSLHPDETSEATLHFSNGKEVVEGEAIKGRPLKSGERTLDTVGTFGPILVTVLKGATAAGSDLTWSRWEQGANGPQAVFRYRVPQESPLFFVGFGYLESDIMITASKKARFHGEFAVDPTSGAILRVTAQADLEARLPLEQSDVMVEYGPVVMGGTTYICPTRSVSISRQRTIMDIHEWGENFKVYAPYKTILTDMAFGEYHIFHSTSRMLPGFTPAPKDN